MAEPLGASAPLSTTNARKASTSTEARWGLAALVVLAALAALGLPVCPMAAIVGLPCPGCGLTRACLALLRGDISSALRFQPLVFLVAPFMALAGVVLGLRALGHRAQASLSRTWPPLPKNALSFAIQCVGALLLAIWVARFFGAFGGPVEVQSLSQWAQAAGFTH